MWLPEITQQIEARARVVRSVTDKINSDLSLAGVCGSW